MKGGILIMRIADILTYLRGRKGMRVFIVGNILGARGVRDSKVCGMRRIRRAGKMIRIVENLGGPLCCLERARLVFSELPHGMNDRFCGLDRPYYAATMLEVSTYG